MTREMLAALARLLQPLAVRITNIVSRGVVKRVDDKPEVQQLQVELLEGETRDGVERLQAYGFTSVPEADAECVVIFVGGQREQGYVVATDDRRYRPKDLQPGEVCVYGKSGSKVVLKTNGDIEVTPSSGKVKLTGDLVVTGEVEATGDVKAGTVSLQNHAHSVSGTAPNGPVTFTPAGSTGGPS